MPDASDRPERVRPRASVLAFVLVLGITVAGCFSALLRYDLIGTGHLPRCALVPLILLVPVNALWRRLRRRPLFSAAELMFIYVIILAMAAIPGQQMATYLYLNILAPIYYASPENRYQELFHRFIPEWLVPSKDPEAPAVAWAFEGLPPGKHVPYHEWVGPLLAWTPLLLGLFFFGACLAILFRRRWVEEERLVFPLAQLPVEMIAQDEPNALLPGVFRNKLTWIFFMIPVAVYTLNGIHLYFPVVPVLNLRPDLGPAFPGRPWSAMNYMPFNFYFDMIGITYLITAEMGFSLWFFWIARRLATVAWYGVGLDNPHQFFVDQGAGAVILLTLAYVWATRKHIKRVFLKATGRAPWVDDSHEPLSYRWTVIGLVGSMGVLLWWSSAIGLNVLWALALYLVLFSAILVVSRLVSEAGLFVYWAPHSPFSHFLVELVGRHNITAQNAALVALVSNKVNDLASSTTTNMLQGYKIGDLARLPMRALFTAAVIGVIVSIFACHIPSLYCIYETSIPALGWWPRGAGAGMARNIAEVVANEQHMTWVNYTSMTWGASVTLFLLAMRQRFVWWPFHPLGFVAMLGPQWPGDRYGFSMFLGWVLKWLVVRFGGVRGYRMFRPAAIGLVMGNAVILFFFLILDFFYPYSGVLVIE